MKICYIADATNIHVQRRISTSSETGGHYQPEDTQ